MPDKVKNTPEDTRPGTNFVAAILWVFISIGIALISTQIISLSDQERFPSDMLVQTAETDAPNTIVLDVIEGTFEYDVIPEEPAEIPTGVFTNDAESPLLRQLVQDIDEVESIVIEPQAIRVNLTEDAEAERVLRRVRRVINNFVLNDTANTIGEIAEDNTLIFTTTEDAFIYGRFIPQLIQGNAEEVYESRDAALNGSALAQVLVSEISNLESLRIEPGRLTITYPEGASARQIERRVQEILNDFYPRASLQPNLWLLTVNASPEKIIEIVPVDTGIPLFIFTLIYAGIEAAMAILLYSRDDKLIRPLVRVVGVFLFFWSLFGHEPLWDFILAQIFTTSRQLVHPSATVIEFTAQHLELVLVSSLITIPMGLMFGILVTRENFRELLPLVNNLVNSGQTVPTIAIVAIMAPIIGFGFWPAIIALIAYGLLPVVRNTIAGLEAVDSSVIDSARGMGMTPTQILFQVELPIASSIIMAGVRTSMVINVGTATLGAFVGSGGLGTPIASGLSMTVDAFILLGALPAALLAILVDYILGRIEFVLTPKGLQIEQ